MPILTYRTNWRTFLAPPGRSQTFFDSKNVTRSPIRLLGLFVLSHLFAHIRPLVVQKSYILSSSFLISPPSPLPLLLLPRPHPPNQLPPFPPKRHLPQHLHPKTLIMLSTSHIRINFFHDTRARTFNFSGSAPWFSIFAVEFGDFAAAAGVVEGFAVAHLVSCELSERAGYVGG